MPVRYLDLLSYSRSLSLRISSHTHQVGLWALSSSQPAVCFITFYIVFLHLAIHAKYLQRSYLHDTNFIGLCSYPITITQPDPSPDTVSPLGMEQNALPLAVGTNRSSRFRLLELTGFVVSANQKQRECI